MIPAYLADARHGDHIRFELPADTEGGTTVHEGVIWGHQTHNHATGTPFIAFRISGADTSRQFNCRPDLHIELERVASIPS